MIFNYLFQLQWICAVATVLFTIYIYGTWTYDFFRKRNMKYMKPFLPFIGNCEPMFTGTPFSTFVAELYKRSKGHRYIGMFELRRPVILFRDPELIKIVGVKAFDHFVNHRVTTHAEVDPAITLNLFALQDQKWRDMRAKVSPIFTPSKLKYIFQMVSICCKQMSDHVKELYELQKVGGNSCDVLTIDMKELYSKYITDIIATVAYGHGNNSFSQPGNKFLWAGKEVTNSKGINAAKLVGYVICPKLMEWLNIPVIKSKVQGFLHETLVGSIERREQTAESRIDLVQMLLAIKKQEVDKNSKVERFNDWELSSQGIVFFMAGLESSSTVLYFLSYELSKYPSYQERLQQEIDSVMAKNEVITYDVLQGMKYLDIVVSEILRMYPTLSMIDRTCCKDYTFPADTDGDPAFTVKKGDSVYIPIFGIQRDPEIFPDPDRFDPERFNEENKLNINPFTYMPFGVGPRHCIGQRFALIIIKVAIFNLLSHFSILPTATTLIPMKFTKRGFFLAPNSDACLGLIPRTPNTSE